MQYSLPIFNADRPFAVLTTWQGQGQLPGGLLGAPNTMPGVLRSEQPIARGELLGEPGGASKRAAWRARHDAWRFALRAVNCVGRAAWRARKGRLADCLVRLPCFLAVPPGKMLGGQGKVTRRAAWRARHSAKERTTCQVRRSNHGAGNKATNSFHTLHCRLVTCVMASQIASNQAEMGTVDEKLDKFIEYVDEP